MRKAENRNNVNRLRDVGKRVPWDPKPTKLLLRLWWHYIKDLQGPEKNIQEMAKQMQQYQINHIEIKAKMDNITKKYRREMRQFLKTGQKSKWPYLEAMQEIFKDSKLVNLSLYRDEEFDFSPMEELDSDSNSAWPEPTTIVGEATAAEAETSIKSESVANDLASTVEASNLNTCNKSERVLNIELAKLEIEKEKLKTLKNIGDQLSSIHRDILKLFKNNI